MKQSKLVFTTVLVALLLVPAYAQDDPNLVGWWPYDDASQYPGAWDASTEDTNLVNDAQFIGGAYTDDGLMGSAAELDGSSYLDVLDSNRLDVQQNMTFCTWIYPTSLASEAGIAQKDVEPGGSAWSLELTPEGYYHVRINWGGSPAPGAEGAISSTGETVVDANEWSHIALVNNTDQKVVTVYINAEPDPVTIPGRYVYGDSNEPLFIGYTNDFGGDDYFTGKLDDTRLYNRPLSDIDLKELYFNGLGTDHPALGPVPTDGATGVANSTLTWRLGKSAVNQNLYLSTDPNNLGDAVALAGDVTSYAATLVPGTDYVWKVDTLQDGDNVIDGTLWSFTTAPSLAHTPAPLNRSVGVPAANVTFAWQGAFGAVSYDVYFGTDENALEMKGNQTEMSYAPTDLADGALYLWRIDAVQADGSKVTGEVWTFTTLSSSPATEGMVAWYTFDEGIGKTSKDWVKGNDAVINGTAEWWGTDQSFEDGALHLPGSAFVELPIGQELVQITDFTIMGWVYQETSWRRRWTRFWDFGPNTSNYVQFSTNMGLNNGTAALEWRLNGEAFQANRQVLPSEIDHDEWCHVAIALDDAADTIQFWKDGEDWLTGSMPHNFTLMNADMTCFIGKSHWADPFTHMAVDDFRIYDHLMTKEDVQKAMRGDPRKPYGPTPGKGALVDVADQPVVLSWEAGEGAIGHRVMFGTDRDNLAEITTTDLTEPTLEISDTLAPAVYYWQVIEVTGEGLIPGPVWSFILGEIHVIDDMEGYQGDGDNAVWMTWSDGFDGNGTGSSVGYGMDPFIEQKTVHGGSQAMPMTWNNTGSFIDGAGQVVDANVSEVSRAMPADKQDWTSAGQQNLVLFLYGNADATPTNSDQVYVRVEDATGAVSPALAYPGSRNRLTQAGWTQMEFSLAELTDVDLTQIVKLTIGVGRPSDPANGGEGSVLIDDIFLY